MCPHNLYAYINNVFYRLLPKNLNSTNILCISVLPEDGYKK